MELRQVPTPEREEQRRPGAAASPEHVAGSRPGRVPWCSRFGRVPEEVCRDCLAYEKGLNCWELAMTPCCDRPREECTRCEVYVSYFKANTRPVEVRIRLADGTEIRGKVYAPRTKRLSDWLGEAEQEFVTVADASVKWHWGEEEHLPVIFVAKREIAVLVPLDNGETAVAAPAEAGGGECGQGQAG